MPVRILFEKNGVNDLTWDVDGWCDWMRMHGIRAAGLSSESWRNVAPGGSHMNGSSVTLASWSPPLRRARRTWCRTASRWWMCRGVLLLAHTRVPECSAVQFDNCFNDSLAGLHVHRFTELNIPKLNTNGYLRYREVFSVAGIKPQECRDPSTLMPGNVPSIGGAIQQLGVTMGG